MKKVTLSMLSSYLFGRTQALRQRGHFVRLGNFRYLAQISTDGQRALDISQCYHMEVPWQCLSCLPTMSCAWVPYSTCRASRSSDTHI